VLLPSDGRPIIACIGLHRNVFTESLPSNWYTLHNIARIILLNIVPLILYL
jgi:hypothetical protein